MLGSATAEDRIRAIVKRYGDGADQAAIISKLAFQEKSLLPADYFIREGQIPTRCGIVIEGFLFRQKLAVDGRRAIVGIIVPGEFIDLPHIYLPEADHDVVALNRCRIAEIDLEALAHLAGKDQGLNLTLWRSCLAEGSIHREWLLNNSRRQAHARTAHLLCEIARRTELAGIARKHAFELPMTQEQLGDAMGLTAVHVNRVLKRLETERIIARNKHEISILDWSQLSEIADFNDRYLHDFSEV